MSSKEVMQYICYGVVGIGALLFIIGLIFGLLPMIDSDLAIVTMSSTEEGVFLALFFIGIIMAGVGFVFASNIEEQKAADNRKKHKEYEYQRQADKEKTIADALS